MRNDLLPYAKELDKARQKAADNPKSNIALILLVEAEEKYLVATRLSAHLGKVL